MGGAAPRAAVGRADLLRIWAAHGDAALAGAARALGFEPAPASKPRTVYATGSEAATQLGEAVVGTEPPPLPERPAQLPKARFFHVVEHRERAPEAATAAGPAAPPWLASAQVLREDHCPPPASLRLPRRQPLTRWSRLWPFLRRALGRSVASREPDLPRLLARLTRGEVLRTLPLLVRHGWSPRIAIVTDYSRRTRPFHEDFNSLQRALNRRHGRLGIDAKIVAGDPGRELRVREPAQSTPRRWPLPPPETPVLILGDLGLLDAAPEALRGWQQFGRRLRSAGCRPLVLCPVPARLHAASLQSGFAIVEWDRGSRLRESSAGVPASGPDETRRAHAVDTLLTMLAPAVVIEPDLLRALRYRLPAGEADVLAEALVWQHADLVTSARGGQFAGPEAIAGYQRKFASLAAEMRQAAVDCLLAQHTGLPASVRHAEVAACLHLAAGAVPARIAAEAEEWQKDVAATACPSGSNAALRQWLQRHVTRQSDAALAANPALAAHWALAQRERLAAGEAVDLPAGVREEDVAYFLHDDRQGPGRVPCRLCQRGDELWLEAEADGAAPGSGSPYAELTLVDAVVRLSVAGDRGEAVSRRYFAIAALPQLLARLTREVAAITLHAEHLDLAVAPLGKPVWASAIGRDSRGLYAEVCWRGERCRLDWQPPDQQRECGWTS
ncbi:MAG: hypothetical protein NFW04_05775, partial [Candidatus Accumulibacter sp.]|uniref:hypothetical protein n=1 Tax=Accumulibacter sp. TaxID=2053492 RepID=UPI0025F29131